ncbi:hypothetical protein ACLB2K_066242 [Fragaria x ananassa]
MGSWGRQPQLQQGDTYYRRGSGTKFHNRKPPHHQHDSWQFGVPAWEKKFCLSVGSVPWKKLLDTKRCMYLYENIVQWNDSAGEEAFQNAKNRFWAKINDRPCDISLPDPDIYIDEIDWNSSIDPELILDLEREPKPSNETKGEGVIVGDPFLLNQPIACTGWGDAEEDFKKDASGDAEHWGPGGKADDKENPWGLVSDHNKEAIGGWGSSWNEPVSDENKETIGGWGSSWNVPVSDQNKEAIAGWGNSWDERVSDQNKEAIGGWGSKWENNNNLSEWNTNVDHSHKNMEWKRADRVCWGNNDARNGADNSGASWYNSRYRTFRFQGDYLQNDRGWRNGGRRNRVNAGYQSSGTWNNCQHV